jgi:hypothetical protein
MTKLYASAVLILLFSLPAQAQHFGGGAGSYGAFGGGGAGGASAGTVSFQTLPSVPRAQFRMIDVTGPSQYVASSWVTFEQGVAQGRADLAARPKPLAEVAAAYRAAPREKATLAFVQDADGNAVITRE